jgi:hypothetical protein
MKLGANLVALAGAGMIAYGIAFLVRNFTGFTELGLTAELVGGTPEAIAAFSPRLYNYISHLHVAIAGLIIGLGLAVVALAWFGIRAGQRWTVWSAFAAPAIAFAIMLPIHHAHGLATLGHVGPGYLAMLLLIAGTLLAHRANAVSKRRVP